MKHVLVDGCVSKCVAPMFRKAFGNQVRVCGEVPVTFVDCPDGVAAARLEFLELCEDVVLADAGAEVRTVFFDLPVCVL